MTDRPNSPESNNCRIALVQMTSSRQVDISLDQLRLITRDIQPGSVDAIFLPENFAALASSGVLALGQAESEGLNQPSVHAKEKERILPPLRMLAKEKRTWVFGGTLPLATRPDGSEVDGGRVRAASMAIDPHGELVGRYDKRHLFDVEVNDVSRIYRESETYEPGTTPVVVPTPFAIVGLSVCYDIRFPHLYRELTRMGAEILAIPSAFTRPTGEAHFEVLLRARAIENSAFVVAACQTGVHDSGRETYGHSMVVSPWGDVVGRLSDRPGLLVVDLDLAQLKIIRHQIPAWRG